MISFYLYRRADMRVVLDKRMPANVELIDVLEAKNWIAAREKIKPWLYEHRPGYGYY